MFFGKEVKWIGNEVSGVVSEEGIVIGSNNYSVIYLIDIKMI